MRNILKSTAFNPQLTDILYLNAAGYLICKCNVQNDQRLARYCTVGKVVASSVRPNAAFHIYPVPNRMHSFTTEKTSWPNEELIFIW